MPKKETTTAKRVTKASAARPAPAPRAAPDEPVPEVFVDFVFEEGLLHVAVVNGTDESAYDVRVSFKPSFRGLGGTQDTSSLPLFRGIAFLAPHRRIETFLDRSSDYFQRKEPRRISARITWHDEQQRQYTRTIVHDLGIYEDMTYVVRRSDVAVPNANSRTPITGRNDHGRQSG